MMIETDLSQKVLDNQIGKYVYLILISNNEHVTN
jgi:hypothetical protein